MLPAKIAKKRLVMERVHDEGKPWRLACSRRREEEREAVGCDSGAPAMGIYEAWGELWWHNGGCEGMRSMELSHRGYSMALRVAVEMS